jgi:hypothetical protein
MKKYTAFAVAMLAASSLYAKPVYLDCDFEKEFGSHADGGLTITLDESTGDITEVWKKTGSTINTRGFWAPNKVSYKRVSPPVEFSVEIDRSTLRVNMVTCIGKGNCTSKQSGSCKIMEVKNRKF